MNRLAVGVLIVLLALAACTPSLSPVSAPDAQSTSVALAGTLAAQTVAALPTLTSPPTNTALPTLPPTDTVTVAPSATNTAAATQTSTVAGTITITVTSPASSASVTVAATGTPATPTATITGTIPSPTKTVPPSITPTDEMIPRFYGTQPPRIDYGRIRLVNQAKAQVYVSFQCDTPDGYYVVVEYPVGGTITVSVPAGRCAYVAWVGGREFAGEFGLSRFEELTMTFKKESVTIK